MKKWWRWQRKRCGVLEVCGTKLKRTHPCCVRLASTAPVEDSFNLTELGERDDGSVWLSLTPKSSASNFDGIAVGFDGAGVLQAMELKDTFGQTTRLEFSAIERNPTLDAALFRFTPPSGADVIEAQ